VRRVKQTKSFLEEEYGLTARPFKSRIATDIELQMWVNREKEVDQWNKVLDDALKTPTSNFLAFIIGTYGMGKTLSLLKIVRESTEKGAYSIYLNLLSEQRPKNPGLDFLLRIIRSIELDKINVTRKDLALIREVLPDGGNAFEKIFFPGNEDEKRLAISFVKGEIKPTQAQLKSMGVLRRIDDVDIAKEYLIGILYILKVLGYSTLVVAADEFEYLFSIVPKPAQPIYLALLRRLFDLPAFIPEKLRSKVANMALFVGTSEDGMMRLTVLENIEKSTGGPIQPLMRRVNARIPLGPLNRKYVRELIERRLRLNRVKGVFEKDPLIPFTEGFVGYVNKLTRGRPSDVIERCDHVLDAGLAQRVPRLTSEFAKEVFKERGFNY